MDPIIPSLVEVNEKDDIVSEAGQPVGRRHGDDKGENVVDKGVKSLMVITVTVNDENEVTVLRSGYSVSDGIFIK